MRVILALLVGAGIGFVLANLTRPSTSEHGDMWARRVLTEYGDKVRGNDGPLMVYAEPTLSRQA